MPTRKIDHGSVFRITSVTGTWFDGGDAEVPRERVVEVLRVRRPDRVVRADPSEASSCLSTSGLFRIASP